MPSGVYQRQPWHKNSGRFVAKAREAWLLLRRERGWSLRQIAAAYSVHWTTVRRVLRGDGDWGNGNRQRRKA